MTRRKLHFPDEHACIAEINVLRSGCQAGGSWSLPQICWHCAWPAKRSLRPPQTTEPTDQQRKMQGFIDKVNTAGWPDRVIERPVEMTPPDNPGSEAIDDFVAVLEQMAGYSSSHVDMMFFGPVETSRFQRFVLEHAAHHLGFLAPQTSLRRPDLRFSSEDAVIADVQRLRRRYKQAGAWSLPQICWHLDQATQARMKPGPHAPDTPEQKARADVLKQTLTSGQLPDGIKAPDPMVPPSNAGDSAIDAFIATLAKFKSFPGPIAPHRIFGQLSDADARKLNLIHCARHLSFLTPVEN